MGRHGMSDEQVSWNLVRRTGPFAPVLPEEGQTVRVITEGGDERALVYSKRLWWLPDMSMYVYFVPLMWRPLTREGQ